MWPRGSAGLLPGELSLSLHSQGCPYCVLSVEAVEILKAEGFMAVRMEEGVQEWQHLGLGAGKQPVGECST